jgi:hypothetical protein
MSGKKECKMSIKNIPTFLSFDNVYNFNVICKICHGRKVGNIEVKVLVKIIGKFFVKENVVVKTLVLNQTNLLLPFYYIIEIEL